MILIILNQLSTMVPDGNYDCILYGKDSNILRLHSTYGGTLDLVVRSESRSNEIGNTR